MFGTSTQLRAQRAHIARLEEEARGLRGLVEQLAARAGVGPAELEALRAQLRPAFPPQVDAGAGLKEAKDAVEARRDGRL